MIFLWIKWANSRNGFSDFNWNFIYGNRYIGAHRIYRPATWIGSAAQLCSALCKYKDRNQLSSFAFFASFLSSSFFTSKILPPQILPFTDKMTFLERWYSAVIIAYDWFIWNFIYYPIQEGLANKYFAHLGPLPPLSALIRNVSLTLVNSHRAIAPPRPSMPSMYSKVSKCDRI